VVVVWLLVAEIVVDIKPPFLENREFPQALNQAEMQVPLLQHKGIFELHPPMIGAAVKNPLNLMESWIHHSIYHLYHSQSFR